MQRERLLILLIVTLLIGIGLMMILNSAAYHAAAQEGQGGSSLFAQLQWVVLGLIAFAVVGRIKYEAIVGLGPLVMLGALGLLVLVLVPGIGIAHHGARRWIGQGGIEVQPSELVKYALIIFLAGALARRQRRIGRFGTFLELAIVPGLAMLLVLKQPDLSTTILIAVTTGLMMFCGGIRVRHLAGAGALALPVLVLNVMFKPYQLMRILAMLDPIKYRHDAGYQQYQALIALGSGGPFGVGLAESHQKLGFVTFANNDFIAAIIGEELGFLGLCALVLLYIALVAIAFRIAFRAPDLRGLLLAAGIGMLIGLQALFHLGVVSSSLPATGLNLPFISSGGSNLLMNCIGLGILVSVSRATERVPRHQHGAQVRRHGLARA
jgi:cell division protein FtsW